MKTENKSTLDFATLHDDATLTTEEVAVWLKMTPDWVRQHAGKLRRPHLPSEKMGKFRRFRWGTLKRWRDSL